MQRPDVYSTRSGAAQGKLCDLRPDEFSSEARAYVTAWAHRYADELALEAARLARCAGNDQVQIVNVQDADPLRRPNVATFSRGLLAFGGLFWGSAASILLDQLTSREPRPGLVVAAAIVVIVATLAVARGLATDARP